jgi:hypothetical protein
MKDGTCSFHFLLTTAEILCEDIDWFQGIEFEVFAAIDIVYPVGKVSKSSTFQKIVSRFQIIQPFIPPVKNLQVLKKYTEFFASENVAKLLPESTRAACANLDRALVSYAQDDPAGPRYVITQLECPLNDIQCFLVKYVLQQYQRVIDSGNFSAAAFAIRLISIHPYAMFGEDIAGIPFSAEQMLISTDFAQASTKMSVLRMLLEKPEVDGKAVLIATDSPFFHSLLDDFLTSEALQSSRYSDDPPTKITTFCTAGGAQPPLDTTAVLIVHDGDWSAWDAILGRSCGSVELVYHLESHNLLDTISIRLDSLPADAPEFEKFCRNAAFQALFCKKVVKPAQILAGTSGVHTPVGPRFVELELTTPDFWRQFFSAPRSRDADTYISKASGKSRKSPKPTISAFAFSQRDRFVRTFFAVGWNSRDALVRLSGLSLTDDMADSAVVRLVSALLDSAPASFASEVARAVVGGAPDATKSDVFADAPFCAYLRENAGPLLDRLVLLHFIAAVADAEDFDFDFAASAPAPPAEWWRSEHDRALLRGVCAYGLGHYEFFLSDADATMRAVAARHGGSALAPEVLTARVAALGPGAAEFCLSRPLDDFLPRPGWAEAEARAAVEHIDRFGVERDGAGDPDPRQLRRAAALAERPAEAVREYVAAVIAEIDAGEVLPLEVRARLRVHIAVMDRLRAVAAGRTDAVLRHALAHAPRWRAPGQGWTPALEQQLFSDMLRQGVHAFRAPAFAAFALSTPAIADRLRDLSAAPPPPIEDDRATAAVEFPIEITPYNRVHALGRVEWKRAAFHNERYIYPIGFKSSRLRRSMDAPAKKARWYSEIVDGGDAPIFRVWMEGHEDQVFEGTSPTTPWTQVLKAVATARRNPSRVASVSGPEAFLLAQPLIMHLIEHLPNAEKCVRYVRRNIAESELVRRVWTRPQESEDGDEDEGGDAELGTSEDNDSSQRRRRR